MGVSVWEEENGEERGIERVCFLEKKEFVFEKRRDSFLNTHVINVGTKEGDGLAIRMGMKLMKRRLCFRITAKLGNSKRQPYSWQEKKKKIYIYIWEGVHYLKKPVKEKKEER